MPDRAGVPPRSQLQVTLRHQVGSLALDVAFVTDAPWTVLFGPSGSGKTTVLRSVAGLLSPEQARIALAQPQGNLVLCNSEAPGTAVPAHRRPFRIALQRAALFPRKTVLENVRYGASAFPDKVEESLALLRLSHLEAERVEGLSGGEAQRVAVARAIAAARSHGAGTWLLLDEPFSGLDLQLRAEITGSLQPWLAERGHQVLSVTHDVAEVFSLGAQVVRLQDGRVIAQGHPQQVLAEERERVLEELTSGTPDR